MARRSKTLRFKLLLVFALLVVLVWSVLWFVAATIVDRQIDRVLIAANGSGLIADCTYREVTGFPFRIELRCGQGTSAHSPGVDARVSGLTVAALIYRPDRMIAEAQSPASIVTQGLPTMEANWDLAHASFRLDLGGHKLKRMDAEVVKGNVQFGSLALDLSELDLNVREDPTAPGSLNFAFRVDQLESSQLSAPVTVSARGTVVDGAALLSGHIADAVGAVMLNGAPIALDAMTVELGDMVLSASGEVRLDGNGLISGDLSLAVAGEEGLASALTDFVPASQKTTIATVLNGLLKNTPATAEINGRPAKEIPLYFDGGRVRVGAFPFPLPFQIPSVNIAAR